VVRGVGLELVSDVTAAVEELPRREALANKEKKPSAKSKAPRIRGVNRRTLTLKRRVSSVHGGWATTSAAAAALVVAVVVEAAAAAPEAAAEAQLVAAAAALVVAEPHLVATTAVAARGRHLSAVVVAARLLRRSRESRGLGSYPGPRPQRSSDALRRAP